MGALHIVVYAEGAAERLAGRSSARLPTAPGHPLQEDEHGPAHILVKRALAEVCERPPQSLTFDAPLRWRGRQPKGSDLLNERTLKMLLRWPRPTLAPDLAVVLIDCDGEKDRKQRLEEVIAAPSRATQHVVAMSIQEFEAWLIADIQTVNDVLETTIDEPANPENMQPGDAKEAFLRWCNHEADNIDENDARCDIVRNLDFDTLSRRCSAFETFLSDIREASEQLD